MVLLPPSSTSDIPILTPAEGASVILGRRGNMQLGPEAGTMRLEREDVISADIFDDMIHFVETKRIEPYCLPGYTAVPEQTSGLSASAPRILLLTGMDCSCAIHCCTTPGGESRNSMLLSRAASPKSEAPILTFDTQGADDPPMSPSVLLEATGDDEGCGVSVATLAMLRSEQEQEKLLNVRGRATRPASHSAKGRDDFTPKLWFRASVELINGFDPVPSPSCTARNSSSAFIGGRLVGDPTYPSTPADIRDVEGEHMQSFIAPESAVSKKPKEAAGFSTAKGANPRDGKSRDPCRGLPLPSRNAQPCSTLKNDEPRTFITSPLYAQRTPNRLHANSWRNITPKDGSFDLVDVPKSGESHGGVQRNRHRRSGTSDAQMGQHGSSDSSRVRPNLIRRQSAVSSTSLSLDMVASSLGSFSWNGLHDFLGVHEVIAPRSARRIASAPDPGMENVSGYFDAALGRTGVTGRSSGGNTPSPLYDVLRQNVTSKEPNETATSYAFTRNITAPLSSLSPDDISYPSTLWSPPASTPPLTYASGPSSPSHSESASNRSRQRSVFGGHPLPEDIERKSAKHAAKIAARRQKRRAAVEASASVQGFAQAQEASSDTPLAGSVIE